MMIGAFVSFTFLNFIAGYQIKVWNAGGCVLGCTFQIGGNETSWKYLASGQTTTSEKFYRLDEPVVVSVDALACGETHCYGLSQKIQQPGHQYGKFAGTKAPGRDSIFTLKGSGYWLFQTYEYTSTNGMLEEILCDSDSQSAGNYSNPDV